MQGAIIAGNKIKSAIDYAGAYRGMQLTIMWSFRRVQFVIIYQYMLHQSSAAIVYRYLRQLYLTQMFYRHNLQKYPTSIMHINIAPLYIALMDTLIIALIDTLIIAWMDTLIIALIYNRYNEHILAH